MRHIILDTETTGLDPKLGHRIIELAAVEMVDRRTTGRNLQVYVDPEREIDAAASKVAQDENGEADQNEQCHGEAIYSITMYDL